ncbi:MAG TPA: hypothetical protein VK324_10420, partial [Tepidisphaeraceae bacterium]|nr:hypothetical protein [Tepidisphaeraceae bacterium]
ADGLVVAALVVNEAVRGVSFRGTGAATQPTQESVRVQLIGFAPPSGPGVTLSVPGDAGIVALAGGAAWAGASGLAIPFG